MAAGYKTGGRKAGTPNKKRSILEICDSAGLDPFAKLAEIAKNDEHPRQFDACKELCQYIEPKKKAIELNASVNQRLLEEAQSIMELPEEDLRKIVEEETKKLK
jgi:hypothetical protein